MKSLSPWNVVKERAITVQGRTNLVYDILGVTILDYLDLYRKFTYSAQYLPQGFTQSQVVYNDVINFFNTIDKDIKKKFKIKTHHNLGFNEEKKFIKDLGNEIISKSSYIDFIRKSKVIICTYPETTFTESLASGIPTILFFKKELYELNPQTSELVSLMHKAKIIFYSAEEAADHLNEIWHDLEKWWNKKETIYARKVFFQEAAIISRSWVNLSDQEMIKGLSYEILNSLLTEEVLETWKATCPS